MSVDNELIHRAVEALERLAPKPQQTADFQSADAFVWNASDKHFSAVATVNFIPLTLLLGVDHPRETLLANTEQFARGFTANNALLWGARGMGKSSLIKSIHAHINEQKPGALVLMEIHREDISDLPLVMHLLRNIPRRFIVFSDDLSFDGTDASYKSLKTALEGGIEGRPENVLFYATSNRRHLMPREMIENERAAAIHQTEPLEEKISLSDRFGLSLGFRACHLETYLMIVDAYAKHFGIQMPQEDLRQQAYLWANTRGGRSGRVAWQFIQDLAGKHGIKI